jgi:hypothetical protein
MLKTARWDRPAENSSRLLYLELRDQREKQRSVLIPNCKFLVTINVALVVKYFPAEIISREAAWRFELLQGNKVRGSTQRFYLALTE